MLTSPLRTPVSLVLLAICGLASACWAQGRVYKQVGPDGRVTFTDKPPVDAAASPPAPAPHAETPSAALPSKGAAKKALHKEAAASAPAPQAASPLDPAVGRALVALMGQDSLVHEYLDLCTKTLPTSFKRYDDAAKSWRSRHAAVLARYPAILQENYTPAEQAAMRKEVQDRTRTMLAPVAAADMGRRIKWCDDNAGELKARKMDLARNHVDALANYRGKR